MDLNKLYSSFHWLQYSSFTLNTEKYVILNNSLLVLQNANHFHKVFFWGVIQCLGEDYYIAFGYQTDAITNLKFFYSNDCQNWNLLPDPQQEHLILTQLCKRPFQGDPGLVIEVVDDAPLELFPDENYSETETGVDETFPGAGDEGILGQGLANITGAIDGVEYDIPASEEDPNLPRESEVRPEDEEVLITSGELKEEDRLAAIVQIITEETAIVPRGGLFKQTDGITVHSRAFEGLKIDDADELCSFQHYRKPQQEWNTNLLTRIDYNYAIDFLDTIDKDLPTGIWTAKLVKGDQAVLVRNLTWPGFTFFHHLETPDYGFIYVGDGQRVVDIPFMTQVNEPVVEESTAPSIKHSKMSSRKSESSRQVTDQGTTETEDEVLLPVPHNPSTITDEIITSA